MKNKSMQILLVLGLLFAQNNASATNTENKNHRVRYRKLSSQPPLRRVVKASDAPQMNPDIQKLIAAMQNKDNEKQAAPVPEAPNKEEGANKEEGVKKEDLHAAEREELKLQYEELKKSQAENEQLKRDIQEALKNKKQPPEEVIAGILEAANSDQVQVSLKSEKLVDELFARDASPIVRAVIFLGSQAVRDGKISKEELLRFFKGAKLGDDISEERQTIVGILSDPAFEEEASKNQSSRDGSIDRKAIYAELKKIAGSSVTSAVVAEQAKQIAAHIEKNQAEYLKLPLDRKSAFDPLKGIDLKDLKKTLGLKQSESNKALQGILVNLFMSNLPSQAGFSKEEWDRINQLSVRSLVDNKMYKGHEVVKRAKEIEKELTPVYKLFKKEANLLYSEMQANPNAQQQVEDIRALNPKDAETAKMSNLLVALSLVSDGQRVRLSFPVQMRKDMPGLKNFDNAVLKELEFELDSDSFINLLSDSFMFINENTTSNEKLIGFVSGLEDAKILSQLMNARAVNQSMQREQHLRLISSKR